MTSFVSDIIMEPLTAVHRVTQQITIYLQNREMLAACLLDMEKVFDSEWIKGLLFKLRNKIKKSSLHTAQGKKTSSTLKIFKEFTTGHR